MIRLTTHGEERVADRLGLPQRRIEQAVANAYVRGKRREQIRGPLRDYLDKRYRKGVRENTATNLIVFGGNIYLFEGNTLVTMWPIPEQFKCQQNPSRNERVPD